MDNIQSRDIYTVSRLNGETRIALDISFPGKIWVEGEISNLSCPSSGHVYFSLKDRMSQVRCAMFKMSAAKLSFIPGNGDHVLIRAKVSLYEPRGDFQLVADHMEPAGEGALLRAFEQLKQKLSAEGLFDERFKKPLPVFPQAIGVITSPTGAAIRDILSVVRRRFPAMQVIIYPTAVQGQEAPAQIVKAIALANQRQECDVLIVARGGGSLEDLWSFNEEVVARAIFASALPVISGVGHEIDFTIADLVADHRAPTPSAAAELITPDAAELVRRLHAKEMRIAQCIKHAIHNDKQSLNHLLARLNQQHPKNKLEQKNQRIDELELRLTNSLRRFNERKRIVLSELTNRLYRHSPRQTLNQLSSRTTLLDYRLKQSMQNTVVSKKQQLTTLTKTLDAISPLATLSRGYAIVTDVKTSKALLDSADVETGDTVITKLYRGKLVCTVTEKS
jgi:exodeoxyribonuclease VII large subunit